MRVHVVHITQAWQHFELRNKIYYKKKTHIKKYENNQKCFQKDFYSNKCLYKNCVKFIYTNLQVKWNL